MKRVVIARSLGTAKSRASQNQRRAAMTLHNLKREQERGGNMGGRRHQGVKTEGNHAPVSIEGEQRGVIVTAQQIIMDVKNFRAAFKTEDPDFSDCHEMAEDIMESLGLKDSDVDTIEKFSNILKLKKIDQSLQRRSDFEMLNLFCEKITHFQEISVNIKQKLASSIDNHLTRYLLSFASEAEKKDIKCVREYEAKIKNYESSVKISRSKMDALLSEINEGMTPFVGNCLLTADVMNQKMDETFVVALQICDIMKKWASDDRLYPAKLWDEIISSNMTRGRMLEELKRTQRKRDDLAHTLTRRTMARDKVDHKLENTKKERRKSKSHKDIACEKLNKAENDLVTRKKELEDTENKFIHRKSNSPRFLEMLENRIDSLKEQVVKLTESTAVMRKQLERYDKTDSSFTDVVVVLEKEVKGHEAALSSLRQRLKVTDADLAQATNELKEREAKITMAKKIREMKLTPATLRKIFYQVLDPATTDQLTDVCRFVSKFIGNSWRMLYQELPFSPPRDAEKKQKDVHIIYVSSLRRDQTLHEQAWECLQKWRVFHRRGNVEQLLHSLKRIEKVRLARRIETKLKEGSGIAV